jgi:hypothetical protein
MFAPIVRSLIFCFMPSLSTVFRGLALMALLAVPGLAHAQGVRIGTAGAPDASAALEVNPGTTTPKGLLFPRLTQAQRNAIANPAEGLVIYQTDNTPGLYQRHGTLGWISVGTLNSESLATLTAPTTPITLAPATTTVFYNDNSNAGSNGIVTLGIGSEGQRLVIVNNDAQYLPVVSASGTGNLLPKYAARYIYTSGGWRRES